MRAFCSQFSVESLLRAICLCTIRKYHSVDENNVECIGVDATHCTLGSSSLGIRFFFFDLCALCCSRARVYYVCVRCGLPFSLMSTACGCAEFVWNLF